MYLETYFQAVEDVLSRIRRTQREVIVQAAETVARSLAHKGAVLVMDTGHMLRHEAFYRAGGLMAIAPFSYGLQVDNPIDQRPSTRTQDETSGIEARTVALALESSKMRAGDILIINSNSGRTANVIEVALACKPRRITTIAICSAEQMTKCPPAHPSGKKLFEVADICIDNCTPHGDAAVDVKNNERMCPLSGLASTCIFWAIQAEAVERLQALGVNPTIFRSVHVSGQEYIEKQRKAFLERGI